METPLTLINDIPLGGRLLHFHQKWKDFGVSDFILKWIKYGLPISSDPSKWVNYKQRRFTASERIWIEKELLNMLQDKVISQDENVVLNPINVVPKKGSDTFRFILDLRKVNGGIDSKHFKMETLQKVSKFIRQDFWATKIDLKKGYFQIPIKEEDQKLLGFSFQGKKYKFQCLPFGLNSAPRYFTKIMKELMKKWREKGLIVFIYIDDILILGSNIVETKTATEQVLKDLEFLGWLVQLEKSQLIPSQQVCFLGIDFNLEKGTMLIPHEKKEVALNFIQDFLQAGKFRKFVRIKLVAQFIGKLEFASLAEQYIMPLLDRLRKQMNQRVSVVGWSGVMLINRGPMKDLMRLKSIISNSKGSLLDLNQPFPIIVNSDASPQGYGVHSSNTVIIGRFHTNDHINSKEMMAILQFFIEAKSQKLFPRGTYFEIRGDNSTALSYIRKGYGTFEHLAQIARKIWKILIECGWRIAKVIYIPSEKNSIADKLSRLSDWKSSPELISMVEKEFGNHTIDRFATSESATTIQFNSWLENDAFQELWEQNSINYCVPPIGLIPQALFHLIRSKAIGTFVVPYWPTAYWFPILLKISLEQRSVPLQWLITEHYNELHKLSDNLSFMAVKVNGMLYFQ